MQSSTSANDGILPDSTCLPNCAPSVNTAVSTAFIPPSTDNTNGAQLNPIKGQPSGSYEIFTESNGLKVIRCTICEYTSKKMSNLKRHVTTMHSVCNDESLKMLTCCGIRFTTKGEKVQHFKSVHESGYKCSSCSTVFTRPSLLRKHLANHLENKPYKCGLSAFQTLDKRTAERHVEKKHSDDHKASVLFVTDDGTQTQMDMVSKGIKHVVQKDSSTVELEPFRKVFLDKITGRWTGCSRVINGASLSENGEC